MPPRTIAPLALLLALLASCASPEQHDADSPFYRYPAGSRLTLNRAVEIAADSATLRFQFGRIVTPDAVQTDKPYCILEVERVRPEPQRIAVDSFAITQVQRGAPEFGSAAGLFIGNAHADDDTPSLRFFRTVFLLRSERQPDVRSLSCQHHQYAAGTGMPRHLTLTEIHQALGGFFTLEPR